MSREDVMRETGLSLSTLKRIEADQGDPNRGTLLLLAKALKIDPPEALADFAAGTVTEAQFMRRLDQRDNSRPMRSAEAFLEERGLPVTTKMRPSLPSQEWMAVDPEDGLPILGEVTAGGLVESIVFEGSDEPERIPMMWPGRSRTYALRVRGESMAPEFRAGEILIVQDALPDELEDGEDAVIQCNGGADGCSTFKRAIFLGDNVVRLMPLNPSYPPIECRFDHIIRVGKVLGVFRPGKFKPAYRPG